MPRCHAKTSTGATCRNKTKNEFCHIHESCPICYENIKDRVKLQKCGHTFCKKCILTWCSKKDSCPYCRQGINFDDYIHMGYKSATRCVYDFVDLDDEENFYIYHKYLKHIDFCLDNYISKKTFDKIYEKISEDQYALEIFEMCSKRRSMCIVPPNHKNGDIIYKLNVYII